VINLSILGTWLSVQVLRNHSCGLPANKFLHVGPPFNALISIMNSTQYTACQSIQALASTEMSPYNTCVWLPGNLSTSQSGILDPAQQSAVVGCCGESNAPYWWNLPLNEQPPDANCTFQACGIPNVTGLNLPDSSEALRDCLRKAGTGNDFWCHWTEKSSAQRSYSRGVSWASVVNAGLLLGTFLGGL
jgi:hypothetical protein